MVPENLHVIFVWRSNLLLKSIFFGNYVFWNGYPKKDRFRKVKLTTTAQEEQLKHSTKSPFKSQTHKLDDPSARPQADKKSTMQQIEASVRQGVNCSYRSHSQEDSKSTCSIYNIQQVSKSWYFIFTLDSCVWSRSVSFFIGIRSHVFWI